MPKKRAPKKGSRRVDAILAGAEHITVHTATKTKLDRIRGQFADSSYDAVINALIDEHESALGGSASVLDIPESVPVDQSGDGFTSDDY